MSTINLSHLSWKTIYIAYYFAKRVVFNLIRSMQEVCSVQACSVQACSSMYCPNFVSPIFHCFRSYPIYFINNEIVVPSIRPSSVQPTLSLLLLLLVSQMGYRNKLVSSWLKVPLVDASEKPNLVFCSVLLKFLYSSQRRRI